MVTVRSCDELFVVFGINIHFASGISFEGTYGCTFIEGHFILVGENRRSLGEACEDTEKCENVGFMIHIVLL